MADILASAESLEITEALLVDIRTSIVNILRQDFGIPNAAIAGYLQDQPPGLTIRVDRFWLPPSLRKRKETLDEIMTTVCRSSRAILDEYVPSLSHGLGMCYRPAAGQIEIGVGPDTTPIYPHIITATVKKWRLTPAGERAMRRQGKRGTL